MLPCSRCHSPLQHILVSPEDISSIYFILNIIQTSIVAVSDDGMTLRLEGFEVVHHTAAEECCAVFECRLVDYHLCTLRLDALHDALYSRLAEVVGVRLHGESVHADHTGVHFCAVLVVFAIAVPSSLAQHSVGDVVLACAVALYDCLDEVLWYVGVVGKQLLRVLRQTVAAVAERWVVIVGADAWVETYAVDDCLCVETLHLGVCVELVEVAHAQCQIGIGEEFHRLCLLHAHEERVDVLLQRALL